MKNNRLMDVWQLVGGRVPHETNRAVTQLNEALVAGVITIDCYSEMLDRLIGDKESDASLLA